MRGSFMTVILDSITVIVNCYKKSASPPNGGALISGTTKDLAGLARKHLRSTEYSLLVRLPHYSRRISQEAYKQLVFKRIAEQKEAVAPFV